MTPARHARFPLAILSLAGRPRGALPQPRCSTATSTATSSRARCRAVAAGEVDALGVSVMGGPQLPTAIALSKAVRAAEPSIPIIWGGAFPTNCPDAALNVPYVDFAVRAQGEDTFVQLLGALGGTGGGPRGHRRFKLAPRRPGHPQQGAHLFGCQPGAAPSLRAPARSGALPDAHLPRGAHRRVPGGSGLPLPLHLLRRRDHVPWQDGTAERAAARGGPAPS